MAQGYGIKAIRPLSDNPHVLGYEGARTGAGDTLLEIWNGPSLAARILGIQKDGQIRGADGTVALPTYGFESDIDTGLYLAAVADLRFAVAGADVLKLVAAGMQLLKVLALLDGSAAAPALGFTSDPDTGLYRVGANELGIAVGGAQRARIASGAARFQTQMVSDRHDNGASGAVDFADGNVIAVTLDEATKSITLTGAIAGGFYTLELIQDGAGGRAVSWEATVKGDLGAAPPQPDTTADRTTLIGLYFNGTSYAAVSGGSFDL